MTYARLEQHFRELGHLHHVHAILHWDEAVMMPPAAGPQRSEAMTSLASIVHRMHCDPVVGDWLDLADNDRSLNRWQRANVREIRRGYTRSNAVPTDLVQAATRANMRCEQAWRVMRGDNDWSGFEPLLTEVVSLARQRADALGEALGLPGYDALVDHFEPGFRCAQIDQLFGALREFLPEFTERVLAMQRAPIEPPSPIPTTAQRSLAQRLMRAVGFDMEHGRLDVSHHPFCGGVPSDVRITTRYDEEDFLKALMATLHETGHAKYEQGLPIDWHAQPVGRARGMGVHESQSLLQEMQVSRSREFMVFAAPIIQEELGEYSAGEPNVFGVDNLYLLQTRVRRGLIRVDADEVSYPAHVILRYDIERRLFDGSLEVAGIPEAWNDSMEQMLGLDTRDNYTDGCMQDVHWAAGAFGYFPTYTLGALISAQLFAGALRDEPTIRQDIARGDFDVLNGWLRDKVWSRASSASTAEIVRDATGHDLTTDAFVDHLKNRYTPA